MFVFIIFLLLPAKLTAGNYFYNSSRSATAEAKAIF